ncbi:uncharacterized protein LOC132705646 isoform X1 [Cylas formicarius]|uniref:uncharacterized protein LOC132705646 isoform X1 n=1 Tax=Cylas formicarius TaxID=197179 RepID=UPI002958B0E7|nr:uncharacterized protein LOC132705646 isoform X1 [Cylas formicarius]XP_060532382.1 uncharacterized protein LOC132705646 isoform X1 [Cylas formicarius]
MLSCVRDELDSEQFRTTMNENKRNAKEFSAEEFVDNLLTKGSCLPCDETSKTFTRQNIPNFYDENLYQRGQRFFYKHIFGMFLGKLLGLMAIISIKSTLGILMLTNNSSTQFLSYKRYVSTIFHMLIWYKEDLHPNSRLCKSLFKVKKMHNVASKKAQIALHYRISQKDMAVTQFGFMGFLLSRPNLIGVHSTSNEDIKGVVHLWRVVGYILGIDDEFNICRESVEETRAICNEVIKRIVIPEVRLHNKDATQLTANFINGMWAMNPFLDGTTFMFYMNLVLHNDNSKISIKNSEFSKLNTTAKFKLRLICYVIDLMKYSLVRIFVNWIQLHALYMTKKFPYLAYYKFGLSNMHIPILTDEL